MDAKETNAISYLEGYQQGKKVGIEEAGKFIEQFLVFDKWYLVYPEEWNAWTQRMGIKSE